MFHRVNWLDIEQTGKKFGAARMIFLVRQLFWVASQVKEW